MKTKKRTALRVIQPKAKPPQNTEIERDAEFIRASDFETIHHKVSLTNTTTHTSVKKELPIRLVQLLERGLILEVPSPSCSKGHNLIIEIETSAPGKIKYRFNSTAKVEELEALPDGTDRITVTLVQYDDREWKNYCGTFSSRQSEIESFFKQAKGY